MNDKDYSEWSALAKYKSREVSPQGQRARDCIHFDNYLSSITE